MLNHNPVPKARDAPVRCDNAVEQPAVEASDISLVAYEDERQLDDIMSLVDRDLSEPYSIFTYRYFLHNWPKLCFVVRLVVPSSGPRLASYHLFSRACLS